MARSIDISRGIAILPLSLIASAGRDIEIKRTSILVFYPDDATASEIQGIIEAATKLARVKAPKEEAS